jgi:hypothetical protein
MFNSSLYNTFLPKHKFKANPLSHLFLLHKGAWLDGWVKDVSMYCRKKARIKTYFTHISYLLHPAKRFLRKTSLTNRFQIIN